VLLLLRLLLLLPPHSLQVFVLAVNLHSRNKLPPAKSPMSHLGLLSLPLPPHSLQAFVPAVNLCLYT
jgi:hypothetical protein